MATSWLYPGSTLVRVIDADTIVASLSRDVGFHCIVTFVQKFRLNRIDAYPVKTELGAAGRDYVQSALSAAPFTVNSVGAYKYGDENMGEVTVVSGANLSDLLVLHGYALPWNGRGPQPAK